MITSNGGYRAFSGFRRAAVRFSFAHKEFYNYVHQSTSSNLEYDDLLYRFTQLESEYLLLKQAVDELDCPDDLSNSSEYVSLTSRWRDYLAKSE